MSKYDLAVDYWNDVSDSLMSDKTRYAEFLKFSSGIYKHSFSDVAMIYHQKPDATKVTDMRTWNKLGRVVNRGERSIVVFGEGHSCNYLFDITQTNGKKAPAIWRLDSDLANRLVTRMNEVNKTEYASLDETIASMCVESVKSILLNENVSLNYNKMTKDEKKTYNRSLLSASRYLISNRCQLNGDISLDLSLNLNALDLFKDRNEFKQFADIVHDSARNVLISLEREVIKIIKDRVQDEKIAKSLSESQEESKGITYQLPFKEGDFFDIEDVLYKIDNIDLDKETVTLIDVSSNISRTKSMDIEELVLFYTKEEQREAVIMNAINNILGETPIIENEPVEVAPEIPPIDDIETIELLIKDESGRYERNEYISDFFSSETSPEKRTEYIKSIYREDVTTISLSGNVYGIEKSDNGLSFFEGETDNRIRQSKMSWNSITSMFAELYAQEKLIDEVKEDLSDFLPEDDYTPPELVTADRRIQCETSEDAKRLLDALRQQDYTWIDGEELDSTDWGYNEENTYYALNSENKTVELGDISSLSNSKLKEYNIEKFSAVSDEFIIESSIIEPDEHKYELGFYPQPNRINVFDINSDDREPIAFISPYGYIHYFKDVPNSVKRIIDNYSKSMPPMFVFPEIRKPLQGEPMVTIPFSEIGYFPKNVTMPFSQANEVFDAAETHYIDSRNNPITADDYMGYAKTDFVIEGNINGEDFTYKGRFDIGDGQGTLSNHIREEYEYTLQMYNENPTEDPKLISDRNEVIQKYKNIIGYLNQYEVYRPDPMDRAIALIDDYCDKEFGEPADFSNMDHVGLAYTTDEYTELPIEVYADLETFRIVTEYDGKVVHEELYNDLDDMCRNGLDGISFDDLVILPDDVIRQRDLDAKQGTQILISAEINGEINYYSLTDKTVDDIMKIAKGESPIINYSNICKRINEVEYAEIQQSEDFTFSVELNFDNNSAVIYSVNNGRGGIPESDRNESNSRIEHISISDYMLEQRISDRTIAEFRSKTAQNFHSINGMNADDIEHDVKAYVEETLSESGIDAQVGEAVVYGSRSRGLEKDGSDIDVVIEIDSVLKEDALFNALNGEEYSIGGIKVDINPIRKEETGSLSSYLTEAERYLDELSKSRTAKPVYTGLGAERIDVSAEYAASMWENGFEVYVDGETVEPHTPESSMELFRTNRTFTAQFGDVKKQQMIDFISNEMEDLDMTMPEDKYIFVRDFIDEEEDDPFKWDDGQNVYLNITKALMERKFDFIEDYLTSVKNDYDSIRAERTQDALVEYANYSPPFKEYDTVIDIPEYGFSVDLKNIDELYLKNDYSNYEGGIDSDGHERRDNYSRQTESLTITLDPYGTAIVEGYDSRTEYGLTHMEYDLSDEVDVSELRYKVSNFIESSDELSISSKKEDVSKDITLHEQHELTEYEKTFLEKDLAPDLVSNCLAYDEVEDLSYIFFEDKQHEAYKSGSFSFGHALSGELAVELGRRLRNGEDISAELGKAILGKFTNSRFTPTESRWVTEDVKLRHDLDTVTVIYGDLQHDVPYSSIGAEVIRRAREEHLEIEVYRATEDGILPDTRFTKLDEGKERFYYLHMEVTPPDTTPWGEINSIYEINNGIYDVNTPSHDGIMVRNDIADRILTKEARDIAFREGGYTCFEEDVAAAVAFRELIDKDLFRNIDEYFRSNYSTPWDEKKESFNDSIDRTIREHYPEYWTKRAEAIIKSVSEEKQAELSGQLMFSNEPDTANTLSEENTITAQLVYNTPYKGIVTFVGTDNKTYIGKTENIIKSNKINGDEYDNSDNSLIYISDNQKIHRLLSIPESGSNITQQEAIDRNIYTLEDYREFTNLQETVLSQYEQSYPILFADKPFEPIHDNSILVKKDRGTAQNYHFNEDDIVHGGAKTKYKANVEAIKILNKLEKENRYATPEEQSVLAGYSGWGGIPQAFDAQNSSWSSEYSELKELLSTKEYNAARASSLTSFYTPPEVIERQNGYKSVFK